MNCTGSQLTAVGHSALESAVSNLQSTAVGYNALANATASYNTAIGWTALAACTTGQTNVAVGDAALATLTTQSNCTAVGHFALNANVADENTAIGTNALRANSTGSQNTAVGRSAMPNCTTGSGSTAVGHDAGGNLTTGGSCAFFGDNAGSMITTGTQNTFLGYYAGVGHISDGTTSNVLYIARNDSGAGNAATWIRGTSSGACYQGNNSSTWSTTSDVRIKKNIVDNNQGLDVINNIRIRNFEYRTPEEIDLSEFPKIVESGLDATCISKWDTKGTQIGVIAQELEEILPDSVITDKDKGNKEVNSDAILWHLVNAVKELSTKVNELESKLN